MEELKFYEDTRSRSSFSPMHRSFHRELEGFIVYSHVVHVLRVLYFRSVKDRGAPPSKLAASWHAAALTRSSSLFSDGQKMAK